MIKANAELICTPAAGGTAQMPSFSARESSSEKYSNRTANKFGVS